MKTTILAIALTVASMPLMFARGTHQAAAPAATSSAAKTATRTATKSTAKHTKKNVKKVTAAKPATTSSAAPVKK